MFKDIRLEGDKVYLRNLQKEDILFIVEYMKDKGISDSIPGIPFPYSKKDAEWYVNESHKEYKNKSGLSLAIVSKDSENIVGTISLSRLDERLSNAMIGYWLSKDQRRKGLVKESLLLLLNYGFNSLNFERIYATVLPSNGGSSKLLMSFGFKYEGTLRRDEIIKGTITDVEYYGLLKSEFTH